LLDDFETADFDRNKLGGGAAEGRPMRWPATQ
jgi:hypothetical protein